MGKLLFLAAAAAAALGYVRWSRKGAGELGAGKEPKKELKAGEMEIEVRAEKG